VNKSEAQKILLLYRPGTADERDPAFVQALAELERDPELKAWFEEHCRFQRALAAKFSQIPVPADLKDRILAEQATIIHPAFPQWTGKLLAVAALLILLISMGTMLMKPKARDQFSEYRGRMVQEVLRAYSMDLKTNDSNQVRQLMASKGAPADYVPPASLTSIQLAGGGVLRWRGNPVSMICYDRGGSNMMWLFVLKESAIKDAPPETPKFATINKLTTASWTKGPNTYILAAELPPAELRRYL